jgi:hypothetical protein
MGSVWMLMMAAGALATRSSSKMIREVVLEPFPWGKARIFPQTSCPKSSWRGSMMRLLAGSTPPQKLIGSVVTSTSPRALPGAILHPLKVNSTATSSG